MEEKILSQEEVIDMLWERRASDYELAETDKDEFNLNDEVKFIHKNLAGREFHEVSFKLKDILFSSATCPICDPLAQHDYGVKVLKNYFKDRLELADSEIEEGAIESNGHVFDFLIYDRLVVHYFDPSYYTNFTRETNETLFLMADFVDSDDYDLLIVTNTDIINLEGGGDLEFENNNEEEDDEDE